MEIDNNNIKSPGIKKTKTLIVIGEKLTNFRLKNLPYINSKI
jgi:hypothetical protein